MDMTKRAVKVALQFKTDVELAQLLGISKQAVSAVGEDDLLPEGRQWQLRALRPEVFGQPVEGLRNAS